MEKRGIPLKDSICPFPRVLLVCPVADEVGGAEQVMLALARELPRYGFNTVLAVMRPGKLLELAREQGTEAYAFPAAHRFRDLQTVLKAALWLRALAKKTNCALLHASHTAHLYSGLAARLAGVPEVWELYDVQYGTYRDPIERLGMLLKPTHSIFTGHAVAAGYPQLVRRTHSFVPPSCIDPAFLQNQPPQANLAEKLNLPQGPTFLTVARLQEHKGHTYLIDAAAKVLDHRKDAVFLIVGSARGEEQEQYHRDLISQCERLGIQDRVRFLGFVKDSDLAQLYREGVAMVHPATSEGYGLVLLEAMGMGLPVIAAAASGPSEIIEHGKNGLLVPLKDSAALASSILCVLGDADLRRTLQKGGTVTSKRLTVADMVSQTADVYRNVLNRAKVQAPG